MRRVRELVHCWATPAGLLCCYTLPKWIVSLLSQLALFSVVSIVHPSYLSCAIPVQALFCAVLFSVALPPACVPTPSPPSVRMLYRWPYWQGCPTSPMRSRASIPPHEWSAAPTERCPCTRCWTSRPRGQTYRECPTRCARRGVIWEGSGTSGVA